MLDVDEINRLHASAVRRWHEGEIDNPHHDGFLRAVCREHALNFRLWHLESIAHGADVDDVRLAETKRRINALNLKRNDLIEKLDELLLARLRAAGIHDGNGAPVNTETPGSVIDRLSILSLRRYHLQELARDSERARANLAICLRQQADLAGALGQLLGDLAAGRKQLRLYRQLKMYNSLLPAPSGG